MQRVRSRAFAASVARLGNAGSIPVASLAEVERSVGARSEAIAIVPEAIEIRAERFTVSSQVAATLTDEQSLNGR